MTTFEKNPRLQPAGPMRPVCAESPATSPPTLAEAVQAAVQEIDQLRLQPVARPDAGIAFEPRAILAILSYCYARKIYGSAAIEDALRRDQGFVRFCANEFPSPCILRRFRRHNRDALQTCLTAVLKTCAAAPVLSPHENAMSPEMDWAEEASQRITAAIFIDSIEMDGDASAS